MKITDLLDPRPMIVEGKTSYNYGEFKKHKVKLTPEERKKAMKAGAVWHFNGGSPTCAIWKSEMPNGKTYYGCNTHRAMAVAPTLKGILGKKWKFIKSTG